jgi:hypothetical protein
VLTGSDELGRLGSQMDQMRVAIRACSPTSAGARNASAPS